MNEDKSLKHKVLNSLYWMGGLKYSGQIISWIITIYVIRLLEPRDYGLMSLSSSVIFFLMMLSNLGLGGALVQTKNLSQKRIGQLFGLTLICHIVLSFIIYFGGSLVAAFFSEPRLVDMFRVLSIIPLLLSFYIIPQSLLLREMDFKTKSSVDFLATLCSSLMTLLMAIKGFGVWSLVAGAITLHVVSMIGYNVFCRKQTKPIFSFMGAGDLFSFGGYLTCAKILWYFYSKADVFICGKILGLNALGIYSTAMTLASIPLQKLMPIINQIAFPAYSKIQIDKDSVRRNFLKSVRMASLLIFPIFFGLLSISTELIPLILGTKWVDAVIPVKLICLILPLRALSSLFPPLLNGIGRPDVNFKNLLFAACVMPPCFFFGACFGVQGICVAWLIGYAFVFFVMSCRSLKTIGISLYKYYKILLLPFISSLIMVLIIMWFRYLIVEGINGIIYISILIFIGVTVFTSIVFVLDKGRMTEFFKLLKG